MTSGERLCSSIAALLIIACAGALPACHRVRKPMDPISVTASPGSASSYIRKHVRVENTVKTKLGDGRVRISLRLHNIGSRDIVANVRVRYLDAQGAVVEETPWSPLPLISGGSESFESTSIGDRAASAEILVEERI